MRLRSVPSILARLFIVAMLFSLVLPSHPAAASGTQAYVATDILNLRAKPNTNARVLKQMWQNDPVTILSGPVGNGWYKVDYYGTTGFAWAEFIAVGDVDGGVGGGSWSADAWVSTDWLNVRAKASTKAQVLGVLAMGTAITVTGDPVNGFYPITYNGGNAWVWAEFVSFEQTVDPNEQWIDVNRTTQTVSLMQGDTVIASWWAAMGFDTSDSGFYSTAIGTYYVTGKYAGLWYTPYAEAYIKWWVGFDPLRDNGFHSYSMNSKGKVIANGDAPTGGCVALAPAAARQLFNFAYVGMRVTVHR